jgi:carbon dioxide concentrating mechanism protein CcmN
MYLPPLQAMHDSQSQQIGAQWIGDIAVHPSAAIAPGVLLQAEEGSQIVISASVCIGMGAVLHSYGGVLEIQEGVNLGAGVLIIGHGVIGAHACIGTSSTIFECSVASQQVLPPGSLLGDRSRSIQPEPTPIPSAAETPDPWSAPASPSVAQSAPSEPASQPSKESNGGARTTPIHGKDYVNTLLSTLIPHRAYVIPTDSES